jgi:hypothetical protein
MSQKTIQLTEQEHDALSMLIESALNGYEGPNLAQLRRIRHKLEEPSNDTYHFECVCGHQVVSRRAGGFCSKCGRQFCVDRSTTPPVIGMWNEIKENA